MTAVPGPIPLAGPGPGPVAGPGPRPGAAVPAAPGRPRRLHPGRLRRRAVHLLLGWLGIALAAGTWQVVSLLAHAAIFPTFSASAADAWTLVTSSVMTSDIAPSIERTLAGFAISAVAGAVLGMLVGYNALLAEWASAVIDFLRSLPTPLLVPVAIVVFGLGGNMVVAIIVSAAIWPVLLNTIEAVRGIDPTVIDTARIYGYRGPRLFVRVLLRAASPQIFAGLRVALSVALAVMVVAEMLGGGSGIGYFIANAQQTFHITDSYAGIIVLCAIGWLFDTLFLGAERRLLAWQHGLVGGDPGA